jgi:hypothetical protein
MATPGNDGEIHEVVVEGRQEGQQVLNVMFFRLDSDVDNLELRMLRALMECFMETIVPVMASTYTLVRVYGKRVYPDLGPILEVTPDAGDTITGASEGTGLPTFASGCINIHSVRGGRSGRGRLFMPGVPEIATTNSYFLQTGPYWLQLLAFAACVAGKFLHTNDPVVANQISLGVFSRKLGGSKPPVNPNGFAAATKLTPVAAVARTGSRKVGRGS